MCLYTCANLVIFISWDDEPIFEDGFIIPQDDGVILPMGRLIIWKRHGLIKIVVQFCLVFFFFSSFTVRYLSCRVFSKQWERNVELAWVTRKLLVGTDS